MKARGVGKYVAYILAKLISSVDILVMFGVIKIKLPKDISYSF